MPSFIIQTYEESYSASSIFCVDIKNEVLGNLLLTSRITPQIMSLDFKSRSPVGSSITISLASPSKARQMDTFLFSPSDINATRVSKIPPIDVVSAFSVISSGIFFKDLRLANS